MKDQAHSVAVDAGTLRLGALRTGRVGAAVASPGGTSGHVAGGALDRPDGRRQRLRELPAQESPRSAGG